MLGLLLVLSAPAWAIAACKRPAAVCPQPQPGAATLVAHGHPATIVADRHDFAGVLRAAHDLQSDLSRVSGARVAYTTAARKPLHTAIIVGTLGHSARVDRIVRRLHIDTRDVAGHWEAYLLQVVDHPEPGIDRALLIAGADKRGTIYGIYELSRRIGVSPWVWWADVPVRHRDALYAAPGRFRDAPRVRYRGLFINDEDPALGGWMKARFGGDNHAFYKHVFELILRLKGNTLWPAMWGDRAFAADDPLNPVLADRYGIVVGTSHAEPMMRAHAEWQRDGKGPWDYARNRRELDAFWRRGIERMGHHESLVTIGMRGDGDKPMTRGVATHLLERIVADQRRIIAEVTGKPAAETPQVWALYKEVQKYYDAGMRVPDDVTLLYSDDNWGDIRRVPPTGRRRRGGYGIYYHFDYVGGPHSYKWLDTVQIERTWEQLHLAYAHGIRRLWIVNVGDIKPLEFPLSFFMDEAWNPSAMTAARLRHYPATWAAQQFGPAHAAAIGRLLTRYTQYNARAKPDLLTPDTFSLVDDHEADRVLAQWHQLCRQVRRIGRQLPAADHDAYYELVAYPILASGNLTRLYVAVARNRLYARQGRASANAQAVLARRLFQRDAQLTRHYEHGIAGGKWTHMMAQAHIGRGRAPWRDPQHNRLPALRQLTVPAQPALGVAVQGDRRAWPGPAAAPSLPPLEAVGHALRTLTVFDRGRRPLRFRVTTSRPWLHVTPAAGRLGGDRTLRVSADWKAVPAAARSATLTVHGSDGRRVQVRVPLEHAPAAAAGHGFVENNGHVIIEAQHYARALAPAGQSWQTIAHLGRTLSAVTPWPVTTPSSRPRGDDARLQYRVDLRRAGPVTVRVLVSPTLDIRHDGGLRFAVSLDGQAPKVLTVRANPEPGSAHFAAWQHAVSHAVYVARASLRVRHAGMQTLTLWRIDPGVVFQRVEIVRGKLSPSYLGPAESPRR